MAVIPFPGKSKQSQLPEMGREIGEKRRVPEPPSPPDEVPIDAVPYAELHCLSDFSFQRGASNARELFERAKNLGYAALAITDECSLAGIVRAWEASKATGVALIVGCEIRLVDGPSLVLLVENQTGYSELCRLITLGRTGIKTYKKGKVSKLDKVGEVEKGEYCLRRADLENLQDGLLMLWTPTPWPVHGAATKDPQVATASAPAEATPSRKRRRKASSDPIETLPDPQRERAEQAAWVARHFGGRAWIAVELHCAGDDAAELSALRELGAQHGLPLVASGDVHMHRRSRRALQDVMTAIRLNCLVAEAGYVLFPNGERHLRRIEALRALYPEALLAETLTIAQRCQFDLGKVKYEYPCELVPPGITASAHLRHLVEIAKNSFWNNAVPPEVDELLEKELVLIAQLGYEHFFLTVHEIVAWARARPVPILCQGRGSAANSAVCFCLGITTVNPEGGNLRIERFISETRNEPPDIDVDFEHERREEVLQHVFEKYGRDRAALAATVITWQGRSAVRAVGAALGFSEDQLDQLSRIFSRGNTDVDFDTLLREQGFDPNEPTLYRLNALARELHDMPRHLSQHVGGFVISEHPLHTLVPVENAAMDDRTIIQWDKDDLESLKLLKVDCLALGMLTCLRKCMELLTPDAPSARDALLRIPQDDPQTYAMIQRADTIGVFQIESRAQMSMLPRLKPKNLYDLVIEVAIVRPGPIQGGMVHPYLRRRSGLEENDVPDKLRPALARTLGIPIFQEQVLHLLQLAADFSPDEADRLRRSMAAWKRNGGLEHFYERIVSGMLHNGFSQDYADQIYKQILGFGSYGFPESHATSFAQLAYLSSWLKCHHPAAFTCALLNSLPMGFYGPAQLIQDAQRHDVTVRPVDVMASAWDCTLEGDITNDPSLRLGLRQIRGLSVGLSERLVAARQAAPFRDVVDLVQRAELTRLERDRLAEAGALVQLSGHRHRARWDSAGADAPAPLLRGAAGKEVHVDLRQPSVIENVFADYATQGLSVERHPIALVRKELRRRGAQDSRDVIRIGEAQARSSLPETRLLAAGLVTVRQRPPTASGATFVTLEDEHGQINVVIWKDLAKAQRRILLESTLLAVHGVLQAQQGVYHLIAKRLQDFSELLPQLGQASRDFH